MRRTPDYEWLEHTADIRVSVRGETEAALHESAALTLFALMAEVPTFEDEVDVEVVVEAPEVSGRLIGLLRELLFRFDVDGIFLVAAEVRVEGDRLHLHGRTIEFDPERHTGLREVKAVTYHQLEVGQDDAGWWAKVVFDV